MRGSFIPKDGCSGTPTPCRFANTRGNLNVSKSAGTEGKPTKSYGPHQWKKRYVSHYGVDHEPIAIKDAMKNTDAKAAVDKEWGKLKNLPARDVKKAKPKTEEVLQAKKVGIPFHFASFMDRCHLKHSSLPSGHDIRGAFLLGRECAGSFPCHFLAHMLVREDRSLPGHGGHGLRSGYLPHHWLCQLHWDISTVSRNVCEVAVRQETNVRETNNQQRQAKYTSIQVCNQHSGNTRLSPVLLSGHCLCPCPCCRSVSS